MNDDTLEPTTSPPAPPESREQRLRRALRAMMDNTPADATPRSVRRQAVEALEAEP